jgi:hypothetical protein
MICVADCLRRQPLGYTLKYEKGKYIRETDHRGITLAKLAERVAEAVDDFLNVCHFTSLFSTGG